MAADYISLGKRAILELLEQEHAAAIAEFQAKIADQPWPSTGEIEPHHLSDARHELERQGEIVVEESVGRGSHPVPIARLATQRRNVTAVRRAAARKRLLMGRYLGWAQGTRSRPGIVGPAAETVVHESLRQVAADAGYRLVQPGGGGVTKFLGTTVSSLDNAAFYYPLVSGLPGKPIAVPIEVKGGREWLYAWDQEPYQLLDKAAILQQSAPQVAITPLFICRKAHITLFRMAKDLGFFVIDTLRQYINPSVPEDKLREVRAELGFHDLVAKDDPDERIVRRLTETFPRYAERQAERWAITASDPEIRSLFSQMWRDPYSAGRSTTFEILRDHARRAGLYETQGW